MGGIYFTKLTSIGKDKETAELTLLKGLNILSGASNTGKSYIVQCLDYILGSGTAPKPIIESIGYNRIRAELHSTDGQVFTLDRIFSPNRIDPYITVANCEYDSFNQFWNAQKTQMLYWKHDDRNDKNISRFLLKLIGLDSKKLRIDQQNHKKTLSFRDLANFVFVSETRIIDESSPIYSGQYNEQTMNSSLFKLLLTGEDDDALITGQDIEENKSRTRGKLEWLTQDIQQKTELLERTRAECSEFSIEEINMQIDKLVNIVHFAYKELKAEEEQKSSVGKQISEIRSESSHDETLLSNFLLLQEHYRSDIGRLEFINEGKQGLDQLEQVNCPLCNSLIDKKILEPYTDQAEFLESVRREYVKEQVKSKDLSATIEELGLHKQELEKQLSSLVEEYERIDSIITNKLQPVHDLHHGSLEKFLKLRDDKQQVSSLEKELVALNENVSELNLKLKEKVLPLPAKKIPENAYASLSNEIKQILNSWSIDCKEVYYDEKDNDLVIDGDKRLNSGKGLRAIYLSAFMIGVMKYCLKNNLNHPNFLLLDAPLTAYKHKDRVFEKRDEIPEEVNVKFYESLVSLPEISQMQIIVVENDAPPLDVLERVNHVHFTGNLSLKGTRAGFYPVNKTQT